jgi:hypothetical protein
VLPERALLGLLTVRAIDPASGDLVCDSPESARVELASGGPTPPLGATDTRVTGTLRYRECFAPASPPTGPLAVDGSGCAVRAGDPVFRPIRQARVEVWDQSVVPNVMRAVVETNDDLKTRFGF